MRAPVAAPARPVTLRDAMAATTKRLGAAGIESAALDAALLVRVAAGVTELTFITEPRYRLDMATQRRLESLCSRREAREPVAHILGEKEFWGLDFAVSPRTLVPRPDTETLVQAALDCADHLGGRAARLRLLDLGTGSGCVIIALLHELVVACGLGVDRCEAALAIAAANATRHGVDQRLHLVCADWLEGLAGRFDMIVANPPYIPRGDLAGLMPEVAGYDPRPALDGGSDGLAAYRRILARAPAFLKSDGVVLLEVGSGQGDAVLALAEEHGLEPARDRPAMVRDLTGAVRCILATLAR